ncbi:MAG: glutamine-hydrolyzing carbamoyl-phosphate synthase small subunit [Deltaproteobacteria bacterium]|nr:glutamine-hydrolyzing carbamoyl-phosphate synthase small subunit [Deltaproteobacteria bacterium]
MSQTVATEELSGTPALLALEDGTVFRGQAFGADTDGLGELVFNTAITGYQEVLTDPSYKGQIVMMTAPQIGNVGVNPEDFESRQPFCSGFVVRELSARVSNWRANGSLGALMAKYGVSGIAGIDTRAVTRRLRISGAQRAIISRNVNDVEGAVRKAQAHRSMEGCDLTQTVTAPEAYEWHEGLWQAPGHAKPLPPEKHHVVAYDFGIKRGILRHLRQTGCKVTVVPASTSAKDVLKLKPTGVFLSNGPGDPAPVDYAIESVKEIVASKTPLFGICLGHQILGLALGGKTYKLKFGHHGANHPVMDMSTGKVEITSQNHGFCVDVDSLAGKAVLTHVNLNDKTVEGLRHESLPVFSVQYHPEASPGPNDSGYLFGRFVRLMDEHKW